MASDRVLGRTEELATIESFVAGFPFADGPRALVLVGEAGIGKTVLWTEAERLARARDDMTVLTARAAATETDLAYVALTDLLSPLAATGLPALPRPQAEALASALLLDAPDATERRMVDPRTIGTAVLGLLRGAAANQPLLLAIDDAQWIDAASAAALEFALRRVTDMPIGVISTVRVARTSGDRGRPPGVTANPRGTGLATVMGDRTVTVDVGPISLGVLHHLVRDRAGAALTRPQLVRLEAASGGNPLLAIELGRELARLDRWPIAGEPLPIPTDTTGLLTDRIARLDELDRDVLFVAAATSSPTVTSVADTVGDEAADRPTRRAIDAAIDSGLLVATSDGRLRFGHPLMAEAALRAVTPAQARDLHARLADRASSVEDRGRHLALAADGPDADRADAVDAAATAARRRGATSIAAGYAEAAAELTPPEDVETRAARWAAAGRWFAESGEIDRGRTLLRLAETAFPTGDARAAVLLALAQIAGWEHGPVAVVAGCEAALVDARDPDLRARIRLRLAGEREAIGLASAIEHADAAVRELETRPDADPDLLACALFQGAQIRFESGMATDLEAVERGSALLAPEPRIAADGDVRPESFRAHAIRWQWAADHDDFATALPGALADLQRTIDLGLDRPLPISAVEVAYVEAWMGDLDAADRHAAMAAEAADLVGTREAKSAALAATGFVVILRGDLAAGEAAARAGLTLAADPLDWLDGRHQANLGFAALAGGDAAAAARILGELFDRLVREGSRDVPYPRITGDLIEAAVAAGDLVRARTVLDVLTTSAQVVPRPWATVMAARGRALLLAAESDLDGADGAARDALAAAAALPMPVEQARTELIAGRIARRRKERRRATEHLTRAIATFQAVGANAWLKIAEADLARLGRGPGSARGVGPGEDTGWERLTETEDRVARLAASGLTNREVGEAAFLTPKSVEGVLARVYGKLGIRSRAELGAWLAGKSETSGAAAKPGPRP